jgi:DNA-binding transcriptional MocR family regulator
MNQTLAQIDLPPDMIHLGIGQPSTHLLPLREMENAAAHCLSQDNRFFLAYGREQGNDNFRKTLADFLTDSYPEKVEQDQLLITNGNSQALDFICTCFTNPGDTILVEEPSYFLALRIFADRKLNLVSIPMDDNGIIIKVLKDKLDNLSPAFLYTIPTYHNPAGVTLSGSRRKELVSLCLEKNVLIVADEVYHFLNYEDEPPRPMGSWIKDYPVISLGSFSKILAPGLRLGWIQTHPDRIKQMAKSGLLISGGGFNPFASEIVNSFIGLGLLNTHIRRLKSVFRERIKVFCHELHLHLPKEARFNIPAGGYFIWIRLPVGTDTRALQKAAQSRNVDFHPGYLFSHQKGLINYIRLSFALYDEPLLCRGARRLGKVISDFVSISH